MTSPTDPEAVAEAMEGDPGAVYDETQSDPEAGAVGVLGTEGLAECADRLAVIGRAARNELGDRIVALADLVREIADEARGRLAMDAGADELRARAAEEHERRRRAAAADAAAPEQETLTGFAPTEETFG